VHKSIPYKLDTFTPTEGLPSIPLVPAEDFYRTGYRRRSNDLELPDDLEESFNIFFALPVQPQDRFLQASYWLNQANRVDSFSAMFMHTIQAIESLAWQPRSQTSCPTCGKAAGRPGPVVVSKTFDGGTLGMAGVFRAQGSVGFLYKRWEIHGGDSTSLQGPITAINFCNQAALLAAAKAVIGGVKIAYQWASERLA